MRAFISIPLSPSILASLESLQQSMMPLSKNMRWSLVAKCHLTLSFIGEFPEKRLPDAQRALAPVAEDCPPFPINLNGIGTFPPSGAPSVVWAGIHHGEHELRALACLIRDALQTADIPFDAKRFAPHITIGRAKTSGKNKHGPPAFVPRQEFQRYSVGDMMVDSFSFMESRLHSNGPEYIERIPFALRKPE